MLNAAHVLETALLLLAAFLVGATVGSLARMVVFRLAPAKQPTAFIERKAIVLADRALVSAPAIEPLARPARPEAPAEVPTPDFSEIAQSLVTEVEPVAPLAQPSDMAPARKAGQTTSGHEIPSPQHAAAVVPVAMAAPSENEQGIVAPAEDETVIAAPMDDASSIVEPNEPVASSQLSTAAAPETVVEPANWPEAPVTVQQEDETAAMRAIEGTWTPRRAPSRRTRKAPPPEGMIADEPAAEKEQPGRPVGLAAPRGGVKDSLTNIIGILPVIEKSLNKLGVYHFDQLGQFSDENVAWLEGHLGIPGRIDREQWREQARELAVIAGRAPQVAE